MSRASMVGLLLLAAACGHPDPGLPLVGTLERDRIEIPAEAWETLVEIAVSEGDQVVAGQLLARQDAVLGGIDGGLLLSVNIDSGEVESRLQMDALPAWDGLAGANGKLFLSTLDGSVICFAN